MDVPSRDLRKADWGWIPDASNWEERGSCLVVVADVVVTVADVVVEGGLRRLDGRGLDEREDGWWLWFFLGVGGRECESTRAREGRRVRRERARAGPTMLFFPAMGLWSSLRVERFVLRARWRTSSGEARALFLRSSDASEVRGARMGTTSRPLAARESEVREGGRSETGAREEAEESALCDRSSSASGAEEKERPEARPPTSAMALCDKTSRVSEGRHENTACVSAAGASVSELCDTSSAVSVGYAGRGESDVSAFSPRLRIVTVFSSAVGRGTSDNP